MNTLSQCSVCSCKSVYEGTKHLFVIAQYGISIKGHVLCRLLIFFFQKKIFRPTDSLRLPHNKRAESCYLSVMKDKADWSRNKMVLLHPSQPFKGDSCRSALLPFRPVLTMPFLCLAYIHKLQHTEEFLQKHAGPVSWLTLTRLWNWWELFPCLLSTFCLGPERDPPSLSDAHTHRDDWGISWCVRNTVCTCARAYTRANVWHKLLTQIVLARCPH